MRGISLKQGMAGSYPLFDMHKLLLRHLANICMFVCFIIGACRNGVEMNNDQ